MRRLVTFFFVFLLVLPLAPAVAQPGAPEGGDGERPFELDRDGAPDWRGDVQPDVLPPSLRAAEGTVQVIAELTAEPLAVSRSRGQQGAAQAQQNARVQAQQDGVVTRARARDGRTQELARVRFALNAVALEVPADQLAALAADPAVERVNPVIDHELDLSEGVPYMGGTDAHDAGATGEGIRIAVLDTGVDYTHAALGGPGGPPGEDSDYTDAYLEAYGETTDGDGNRVPDPTSSANRFPNEYFPNDKVVDGYDFVGEHWDGTPDSPPLRPNANPIDRDGHGTHVAHIAAGQGDGGDVPDGMAPDAEVIAVKVCSSVTPSCSGIAILQAIDFALSPSGDPDMSDRVDVINMSLGSLYGQSDHDSTSAAVENATLAGVLTVASAGNSSDNPYITGTPAASPSALSVAAAAHPTDTLDTLQVAVDGESEPFDEFPAVHQTWSSGLDATVDGELFYDDSTPELRLGCRDASGDQDTSLPNPFDDVDVEGKIVVVDRGACTFSEKIANIALADGIAGVIAQNAADPPFGGARGDCPDDACEDIPGFMIFQADGAVIKAALEDDGSVWGIFDPEEGLPAEGTMAGFSSRGPSMNGNLLKPEITGVGILNAAQVGRGEDLVLLGGTSMSAPAVAGAAAAVLDGTRDGDDLREPHEIKSVLMNTADRASRLSVLEASQPGVAGGFAPLTRAGMGMVDPAQANGSPAAMWDAENPGHGAALSFGFVDVADGTITLTREIAVRNYSDAAITYSINNQLRYPGQSNAAALAVTHPGQVQVGPGETETFQVTLTINGDALDWWEMDSGFEGDNGVLLSTHELDGYIVLSEVGGDDEIAAPFQVLPRQSGETTADADVLSFTGLDPAIVGLNNAGVGWSFVNTYDLLGTSDEQDPAEPGAEAPVVDLRAAGLYQEFLGGACDVYMEFAVNTWERTTHANFPDSYELWLDTDGDGEPNFIVFNMWGEPLGLTGNNLSWVYDVAAEEAFALNFVEHPTNSANTVMPFCSGWFGLDADVGDEIGVTVLAADAYFTGAYTDVIEDVTITYGVNAFDAGGDFNVPAGGTGTLGFWPNLDAQAEGVMLVLTGLRGTEAGWFYSGAPEGAETIILDAEAPDAVTERLFGANRYATAAEVSQDRFGDGEAGAVILTRGDDFADALAGAPLAVALDAPLLLTPTASLHAATSSEIERVLPEGGTVYILGGTAAVSESTADQVEALGYEVERIAGANRYATAVEIAEELGDPDTLLITTGLNFPDALAAGAAAVEVGGAVLLSRGSQPAAATDAYLAERGEVDVYAIGGPSRTAYPDATDIVGANRVETAVMVAEEFFSGPQVAGVTRSDDFPDALAGSAHIGALGGPILLTNRTELSSGTSDYLCDVSDSVLEGYVYGGSAAVSAAVFDAVDQRIRGDGC